jgi:hypothetical protein
VSAGWIDAVAIVETAESPLFTRILERHLSGVDATYWLEEHLCVDTDTEEDEALLHLALPDWDTIGGIRQFGERGYLLPPRLSGDVHRWLDERLFEGAAATLTMVGLELRDDGVLRRFGKALDTERALFVGEPPQLCRV